MRIIYYYIILYIPSYQYQILMLNLIEYMTGYTLINLKWTLEKLNIYALKYICFNKSNTNMIIKLNNNNTWI